MNEITINLTEKEAIALNELCSIQELSEEQVLRQALRQYQLVVLGLWEIKEINPLQKSNSFAAYPDQPFKSK